MVPPAWGVKFKTTFIITKKAFLSASAHLTLIIASFQRRKAIKLGWVLNSLSSQCCTVSRLDTALIYGEVKCILLLLPHWASKHSTKVSLRSTMPEDRDKHFKVDISKEKVVGDMKGSVCSRSHCKHNPRIVPYVWSVRVSVLDSQVYTFVCAHMCLFFYSPRALGPFSLIVLWVSHWGGRRGRLAMFPVGEALMFGPGGNTAQSHFPSSAVCHSTCTTTSKVTKLFMLCAVCI